MQVVKDDNTSHDVYTLIEDGKIMYTVHCFTDYLDKSKVIDTIVYNKYDELVESRTIILYVLNLINTFNTTDS